MYPEYLVRKWFEEYGVNAHHIQSYNHFTTHGIRQMIQLTPIHFTTSKGVEIDIAMDNVCVPLPYMYDESRKKIILTPHECRQKSLTYSSPIYVSVIETRDGVRSYYDRVILAHIPIMVRSSNCVLGRYTQRFNECLNDPGGYFIINGIDRVLVTQQRNTYNFVSVYEGKGAHAYIAEIRSMSEDTNHSVLIQAMLTQDGKRLLFQIPFVKTVIPLSTLLLAFGVEEECLLRRMTEFSLDLDVTTEIQSMFRETRKLGIVSPQDALQFLGDLGTKIETHTNRIEYARQILDIELFPHLGIFSTPDQKIELLVYMAYRLWAVYQKKLRVHDKDNLAFKRFENSGILMGELFKSLYRSAVLEIESEYEKNTNLMDIFTKIDHTITKNIKYCFSTGKWGVQRNTYIRQGVSQVLNRLSFLATLSHLQRIVIPIGKEGKNFKIRQIHPSSFGYICLYETPEGQSCGIVLNMTLTTRTSEAHSFSLISQIIRTRCTWMQTTRQSRDCIVFLNGLIVGYTSNPENATAELKQLRAQRILPHDVSIAWDRFEREIRLFCDKGRLIRPFLKAPFDQTDFESLETFSEAVDMGYVEWLDSNEVQSLVIAMYPHERGDYCEIHPSLLLGVCAGAIPFLDHNQSPRNVYEASMMKQAIGMFATNYPYRYDAVFHTLDYPQKSLVSTQTARLIGMHDMPAGVNCIVAISTHGGWNAEDSLILNRAAIERGLFCSNTYHTYTFEDKTFKSESCKKICVPPLNIQKPEWNYYHLDDSGIIRKGAIVTRNDVILGQVHCTVEYKDGDRTESMTDCSELAEDEGVIDRVETIETPNGNRLIKVIIRQLRIPEIGDKFANMAAQKGTCALILPPEDMPFTRDGITPDVMMNSHALPSRMTISMLLEMVVGKTGLLEGELKDATAFSESSINIGQKMVDRAENILLKHGYEKHGWEMMCNGETGKPLRSKIFIGTSYYQKLKHMVTDKIHARSYGNVTSLTRQPLAGRSKDGGLRLGEMERDCLLAHGSVSFLRERLFDMSDAFSVLVCNECGVMSNHSQECHNCKNNELIRTNAPYASKLLFQMLNGCLIKTKFHAVVE